MKRSLAILVLSLAAPLLAQDITVPEKIDAKTNRLASVVIKSAAKDLAWVIVPSADIDIFREFDPDTSTIRLRFLPYKDGVYSLVVAGATGDKVKQSVCLIIAAGGSPKPIDPPDIKPPPVDPVKETLGFVTLARTEFASLPASVKPLGVGIANNFEAVAAKLAATAGMTIDDANAELRERHRATLGTSREAWLPWFVMWGGRADELNASGKMTTREHYVTAYTETAAGLRAAK